MTTASTQASSRGAECDDLLRAHPASGGIEGISERRRPERGPIGERVRTKRFQLPL
jgi:hypothetical protein